jgi:hypothetical protein
MRRRKPFKSRSNQPWPPRPDQVSSRDEPSLSSLLASPPVASSSRAALPCAFMFTSYPPWRAPIHRHVCIVHRQGVGSERCRMEGWRRPSWRPRVQCSCRSCIGWAGEGIPSRPSAVAVSVKGRASGFQSPFQIVRQSTVLATGSLFRSSAALSAMAGPWVLQR